MADLHAIAETLSNLTVMEAAQLTKILEEKWGVSASAPMGMPMMAMGAAPAAAAAPVEEEEEQTEFTVILQEVGPKKIDVIKEVRKVTNLGLREAKEAVDGAPSTLLEAVSKEVANDAKKLLEDAGAKVVVK